MKHRAGFTLLEMMVVLAIAALIIGISASSVQRLTEEHALRKTASDVEQIFMQAAHQAYATSSSQIVAFDKEGVALLSTDPKAAAANARVFLPPGARMHVMRMGSAKLVPAAGQRVLLRPGGLCEPLTFRLDWQGNSMSASLDPLTGGLLDVQEFFTN